MKSGEQQAKATAASGGRPRSPRIQQAILNAAVELVLEIGFKSLTIDAIAAKAGVGRMTIYRRWPNKAAIVMEAFVARVDPGTLFLSAKSYAESIRLQMRTMAKAFRGKDGALIRALLAEAQFDPELATALRERWTMPRRRMAIAYFEEGKEKKSLPSGCRSERNHRCLVRSHLLPVANGYRPVVRRIHRRNL